MRGHITSPPLLWVHQRHPTRSMPDCLKNSNDMTHFQQCTCTAHIFNLSAMTGTIILPSASSSSLGGDGIRIIQQSRRSGRLFFSVFLQSRSQETVEVFGDWVRDDTRCWRLWVPPVLAFSFTCYVFDFARSHGRSRGRTPVRTESSSQGARVMPVYGPVRVLCR